MNARVNLPEAREVCPTTTRRLLSEGALLVDVRERAEVEQIAFDLAGVLQLPLSELELRFDELPRDRDLVIACQSGPRSLKATYFLMFQGYTRVSNMQGGLVKWASKGFPTRGRVPAATGAVAAGARCGPSHVSATDSCGTGSLAVPETECCVPASGSAQGASSRSPACC
ncbi:MAG TPA: rhodanese-like domain-containing protein [Casimicrobium sp.]|nr:rhodanese-like domain-containing protein [Casimicrobium sp.]